jgi:hypothetical protein
MERSIQIFDSHAEADEADRAYYASLTPQERLDLLLEMVKQYREGFGEAGERLERVCRIDELSRR